MVRELFDVLFVLALVGPVLAVLAGGIMLLVPARVTIPSLKRHGLAEAKR